MKSLQKISILLFCLVLIAGFAVRLYRFDNPIADWHSWRQADTSAVSRNFVKYGFDLLHPRMNNISNVQSGIENPQGYFYAEFPIYNATQAGLYVLIGHLTIEEWGRLVSIFMSLIGSIFLFLIVKRHGNKKVAWLTLIFYIFLPFNIYYSRTILPDTSMVAMIMGGIYFFDRWIEKISNIKWLVFSLFFTAIALLLKPYALFYSLPFFILAWNKFNWKLFLRWELWLFTIISIAPLAWWRYYMLFYPEGIPANAWLFNGNGIRFRPAFFRWIFYERITKLISGFFNAIFLIAGVKELWENKKEKLFLLSFGVSAFCYLCIIATGNVQHDYYQIVVMPAIVIFMAYGAFWLLEFLKKFVGLRFSYIIVGVIIVLGFWLSWQQVKDYFNINNPAIVEAGKAVDRLTPTNAKVLAPLDGDSSFLYQTNRQGWASFEHDLPVLIKMGANYLVLANPSQEDINSASKKYKVVANSSQYAIFNLNQKP